MEAIPIPSIEMSPVELLTVATDRSELLYTIGFEGTVFSSSFQPSVVGQDLIVGLRASVLGKKGLQGSKDTAFPVDECSVTVECEDHNSINN